MILRATIMLVLALGATGASAASDIDSQEDPDDYTMKCSASKATSDDLAAWCEYAKSLQELENEYKDTTDDPKRLRILNVYVSKKREKITFLFDKFKNNLAGRSGLLNNSVLTGATAGGAVAAGAHPVGGVLAFVGAIIMGYRAEVTNGKSTGLLISDMVNCRDKFGKEMDDGLDKASGVVVSYTIRQANRDLGRIKGCGSLSTVSGAGQ